MSIIWAGDDVNAKRCYKVYQSGQYVGTLLLTMAEVADLNAKAVYLVKPSYWKSEGN